jgi:Ca-activated chloride channel family protein
MRFSQPLLLLLLLLLPVFWYCHARAERYLDRLVQAFVVSGGRQALWRRKARRALPLLALFWMTVSLAGPAAEVTAPEEATFQSSLVITLDVSKSMLAEDVLLPELEGDPPEISNRLNLARRFLYDVLGGLKNENAGLAFFAGRGLEIVPLTRDHGFFRYILRYTDMMELTDSGSDLGEALKTAKGMLAEAGTSGNRTLILISDGEDTGTDDATIHLVLSELSAEGVRVFCVGVGNERAVFIPARTMGSGDFDDFYRDKEGVYLQTMLREDLLKDIAAATGGAYFRLEEDQLTRIAKDLRHKIHSVPAQSLPAQAMQKSWLDLMPGSLLLALLSYSVFLVL